MSEPTTKRAQRLESVSQGESNDAIDRLVDRRPRTDNSRKTTPRTRQQTARRDVADDIDIVRDGVGVVDRIGEGIDVFLRSAGVRGFDENIRRDFASEADFVERGDIDSRIDAQNISADPIVARDRRDRVADRARRQFADDDPFAEPDDFDVGVDRFGIEDAGLSQMGERRRAGRQFEAETPLRSVDPERDLTRMDDGFGLGRGAQRRLSAREFESEFDLFGTGDLDPETDIRSVNGGFGLAEGPTRQVAAADIDAQLDDFSVGPDDIELRETSDGQFEAMFEREVRR